MVKRLRHRAGYTLTEMLIVVAILGVVTLVGAPVMTNSVRYFVLTRVKLEIQREARAAMSLMCRNLRQAQSSTIRIDQVSGQPYYSRIQFTKMQGTTVSYYQSGKKLIQTVGTTTTTLTPNLRYLAFSFPRSDDMGIISVSITIEESTYSGQSKALHMASEKVRVMN